MRHKLNELLFYQKDPSFFDAIFEAHLPYFEQKEISSFELVLYHHPNIHIETWRITQQQNVDLLMTDSFEIKRLSHLGNRLTIPISSEETRSVYIDHSPSSRMGSGRKETWGHINNKWVCLETKGTWIS